MRFVRGRTVWFAVAPARMMLAWIVIWVAAAATALALAPGKPLKQYGRQSWQSDTGLPQNTVHAVVQTADGFIWMATEGGLVRFDGQEFRVFDAGNTPALAGNAIDSLAVDGQTLWIVCSGGLARAEAGRFKRVTAADGLPEGSVRFVMAQRGGGVLVATAGGIAVGGNAGFHAVAGTAGEVTPEQVAEAADGTVWVGTGHEVVALAAGSAEVVSRVDVGSAVGEVQAIAAGVEGDVWIAGRGGLAVIRNGGVISVAGQRGGQAGFDVTGLFALPNGNVLVGTSAGLMRYSNGALRAVGPGSGVTAGRVLRMFQDREGTVWVAFDLGIAALTEVGAGEPIDVAGALSIFEDREGDMWFGTDVGGVTVLREQAFSTLTTQDGLSDDFVRAVFQDHSHAVWVGTNRGGLNRIAGGKVTTLRAAGNPAGGGLSSNVVLALAESGADLWIGGPDGLSRLRDGRLKLFTTADGLPDDFVRSLYTDRDGSLWIGTRNGLSHYTAAGGFTNYSALDGLGSDLIGSILRGRDGTLWVGTLNGLSRFDGTAFKNFTRKDGLGGDAITNLTEDRAGTLWIAAHGAGLTRLRGGVFTAVGTSGNGLPQEVYSALEAGAPGHESLWLGSSKGVYRVGLAGLNELADKGTGPVIAEAFGVADGMKISECSSGGRPAAWRMTDGSLWFATLKGAASVRPDEQDGERVAPLTVIEGVVIDDAAAVEDGDREIEVAPGRERLTIQYAGLSFAAPQKVRFRYRLEGFDRNWVDAGSRRTAYYTNVPAGSYRFLVESSNRNGVWSAAAAEVRIRVRPRFYRTAWFFALMLLAAAGIVYLVYRLRVRTVEARYRAVLGERNRIAREIHDTLAQGYVGISVQLELTTRMLSRSKPVADSQDTQERVLRQLESTKELVRSGLAEARSSIWNLRAEGAEADSLPARLAATVRARQQEGGPELRFEVTGSFRPSGREFEDEILRIGQEAISNALRHASAKTISVLLSYDMAGLRLKVSDDGKGFEQIPERAAVPGHYGLQGMSERAAKIGARLGIASKPGIGSSVEAVLPLGGESNAGSEDDRL